MFCEWHKFRAAKGSLTARTYFKGVNRAGGTSQCACRQNTKGTLKCSVKLADSGTITDNGFFPMDMCKVNDFLNKLPRSFPRQWKCCSLKLAAIQFPGFVCPWRYMGGHNSWSSIAGPSPAVQDLVSIASLMWRRSLDILIVKAVFWSHIEKILVSFIAAGSHYIKNPPVLQKQLTFSFPLKQ